MTRALLLATAVMAVSACGATPRPEPEPVVRIVEVPVPVPVRCRPDIGPEPQYADSDQALAAAADIFEAMKLRVAGRFQRMARDAVKSAALAGCAAAPAPETRA